MSKALEALKTLRENIRSEDGQIWRQGIRDNDETRAALTVLMDFASTALEQTSTAEAQARALEYAEILEFMERTKPTITNGPEGWSTTVRHMNSFGSGETFREAILQTMENEQARAEAKRIREEG